MSTEQLNVLLGAVADGAGLIVVEVLSGREGHSGEAYSGLVAGLDVVYERAVLV